jgi:predicted exporter
VAPGRATRLADLQRRTSGWVDDTLGDLHQAGFAPAPFRSGLEALAKRFRAPLPDQGPTVNVDGDVYRMVPLYLASSLQGDAQWSAFRAAVDQAFGVRPLLIHPEATLTVARTAIRGDLVRAGLITLGLALGVVILLFGGIRDGLLALTPSLCGVGLTVGYMALVQAPLDMSNCAALPFLIGVGLDTGIHLLAHFRRTQQSADTGATGVAVWWTSGTTILALGSLVTATTPGLVSFGLLMIIGLVGTLLGGMLVLPYLWARFSPARPGG